MHWTFAAVALGFAGFVVLAWLTARVAVAARRLAAEIERTRRWLDVVRERSGSGLGAVWEPETPR
jgi:hypothetical protein